AVAPGGQQEEEQEDNYEEYIGYISSRDKALEASYWQGYLSGVRGSTLLPFIGSTAVRNKGMGSYGQEVLMLDQAATSGIVRFAQGHRLTVNTVMQGVWSYLLYRYTGNRQSVYGVTVSGRPEEMAGVESRVGMYINTLPFRGRIAGEETIVSWLEGIQEEQASGRQYQYRGL
ncbi:condensation domain-containing protein, partial [Flavitalea flava]